MWIVNIIGVPAMVNQGAHSNQSTEMILELQSSECMTAVKVDNNEIDVKQSRAYVSWYKVNFVLGAGAEADQLAWHKTMMLPGEYIFNAKEGM